MARIYPSIIVFLGDCQLTTKKTVLPKNSNKFNIAKDGHKTVRIGNRVDKYTVKRCEAAGKLL